METRLKEDDLKPSTTIDYIPHLLVFSGKKLESERCNIRKNNERKDLTHKILLFSVTNGAVIKTPKSALFSSVYKGPV